MCWFNEAELNCVNTNILVMFELIQFEIGISTKRYFPAMGTAGFERLSVNGDNLEPCPPPRIMANTVFFIVMVLWNGKLLYIPQPPCPTNGRFAWLSFGFRQIWICR